LAVATALRDAEAELARVARALTVGELATSIAHEVNQPLAAIVSNAEAGLRWLKAKGPKLHEAQKSLELIVRDGNRASEVIRRIREFLRKDSQQMATLDISDVAQEAVALVQDEMLKRQITLVVELSDGLPPVRGDRIQLQQVILNLIMNGSEAILSVADGPRELVVISQKPGTDGVLVAVRDSGAGMDPQNIDRMFDAFYTTKPTGMGMGLSISRSIIEAHGGRIWAAPNDGRGLTVQFTLPTETEKL
jgi:signal transduction histidine kinase